MAKVQVAIQAAERLGDRILLLGAAPTDIEDEYGWIVPSDDLGRHPAHRVFAVESFVEKPAPAEAARLYERGALWNTLVLVARARTLWELACERLPHLTPFFTVLQAAIGTPRETAVLDEVYDTMPRVNFSSELLERASDRIAMQSLDGVMWNDWGQPARIVESLLAIGKQPAFSLRLLEEELAPRRDFRTLETAGAEAAAS